MSIILETILIFLHFNSMVYFVYIHDQLELVGYVVYILQPINKINDAKHNTFAIIRPYLCL